MKIIEQRGGGGQQVQQVSHRAPGERRVTTSAARVTTRTPKHPLLHTPPHPNPPHNTHTPGVQKPGAGTEIPASALLWKSLGLQVWDFTGLGTRARHNRKRCERDIQGDSDMGGWGGRARSSVKGRMNFREKKDRGKKGRWVVLKKGGDSESTTGVGCRWGGSTGSRSFHIVTATVKSNCLPPVDIAGTNSLNSHCESSPEGARHATGGAQLQ